MKFQKSQAVTFRNNGKAIPDIAGILKIGKSAIAAFLKKNPDSHRNRKKTRRLQKVMPKEQRNLQQLKKKGRGLAKNLNLDLLI